jgi:hypothetical protein
MSIHCGKCDRIIESAVCGQCGHEQPSIREQNGLSFSGDAALPFFAYGLYKPGELAFSQIREFVRERPEVACVPGDLHLRDGLPLYSAEAASHPGVDGYLIRFRSDVAGEAYRRISDFEPKEQYKWGVVDVPDQHCTANVLIGRAIHKGSHHYRGRSWSGWGDPVFRECLDYVSGLASSPHPKRGASKAKRDNEFDALLGPVDRSDDIVDWGCFFRAQAAYLLLWSAIERFTAIAFGPTKDPYQRIKMLEQYSPFVEAVKACGIGEQRLIRDSRDPDSKVSLERRPAAYYYQVRCNITHRGKGALQDMALVASSLDELLQVFKAMLINAKSEASRDLG